MRVIVLTILNFINKIVPKGKTVIFNSFPDMEGNSFALYRYIATERKELFNEYNIVWSVKSLDKNEADRVLREVDGRKKHNIVRKLSVKGIIMYFRASKIISTHNYITGLFTSKEQTHYNLAHGMPYKAVGNRIKKPNEKDVFQTDVTIANSEYFKEIVSEVLDVPLEKVYITGQPADDSVLNPRNALERLGINKKAYKKVILWSPTYRKSDVGSLRLDGNEAGYGTTDALLGNEELDRTLCNLDYLLLMKFHPMDSIRKRRFKEYKNIRIVNAEEMNKVSVLFNELMGDCDVFITDYSSAFETFMLTGRPVAFLSLDHDDYKDNRGFSIDDPDELIAGEKMSDINALIHYFKNMDEINERWREKYIVVQNMIHQFKDGNSSGRVCQLIFGGK